MSQKFYRTKEFAKLNAKWQKKLEKSGFEDCEYDENNLKVWSTQFSRPVSVDNYKFKESYYNMARHFLNDHMFETNIEKVMWEYHAEGISVRNISKLLKKVKINFSKDQVWNRIVKLRAAMRERYKDKI